MNDFKHCSKCGFSRTLDQFSKNKNRKDGLQFYCKSCSSKLTMESRDEENYKKYQESHREHSHLTSLRGRAKAKGLPFNLTLEDLIIPELCPVLGIPLIRNYGKGHSSHNSPSVDRIIPELGYVKGNVIVISVLANRIKQDATPEQIIRVGKFFEQKRISSISTNYTQDL